MEILLLILLLSGTCGEDPEELFCEGPECLDVAGEGGDGGAGGAGGGEGGAGEAGGGSGGDAGSSATGGGDGGAGGEEPPPPCECDDGNPCNGREGCAGDGTCVIIGPPHPVDDGDLCTLDWCVDGEPQNPSIDVDDGDPCTQDECDPEVGPYHWEIGDCPYN